MNGRIAKRLGWHMRSRDEEWYTLPSRERVDTPPNFDKEWELWHEPRRGAITCMSDLGLIEAFSEALKARTANTTVGRLATTAFGVACLLATPAELSAAFIGMLVAAIVDDDGNAGPEVPEGNYDHEAN